MLGLIVGTVCCTILSIVLLNLSLEKFDSIFLFMLAFIVALTAAAGSMFLAIKGYDYVAAKHKAEIINSEYGTDYTKEQVFYAEDVIDTMRQIQRNRVEINGNLFNNQSN
jgi:hypothetical protein